MGKSADHIIQTDIAHVPLEKQILDVGVFCLSLMGTNFPDFLLEANRVLKPHGKLLIAEVLSRFKDVKEFVQLMDKEMGFKSLKVTKLKDFFYVMVFEKYREVKSKDISEGFSD